MNNQNLPDDGIVSFSCWIKQSSLISINSFAVSVVLFKNSKGLKSEIMVSFPDVIAVETASDSAKKNEKNDISF